ncbi:hypothetical protein E2C06_36055 [Dankookia rubra]|uniref:Uncharacterized protein n=1 Tax=Dankookia rubra TaxID=1442381 RepID=A0A4R5Q561_9PROT|nr:hypothetical protein E2C06_36055 [Dankookia rubra]
MAFRFLHSTRQEAPVPVPQIGLEVLVRVPPEATREAGRHCCVGWCGTSAQHGEVQPAHCFTYRSRPEEGGLFRVQTLSRKNSLFASGDDGGTRWCAAASLVET